MTPTPLSDQTLDELGKFRDNISREIEVQSGPAVHLSADDAIRVAPTARTRRWASA